MCGRGPVADADDAVEREELFLGVGLDGGDVGELFIEMVGAQLDRLGKACDLARGLCAGAQAALLPAAKDQRGLARGCARPNTGRRSPWARRACAR